jgi:hypothetical protein
MSNSPQIFAGTGHSSDGHLSGAFEWTQCVNTGRAFQWGAAEIQASDGQKILIRDDACVSFVSKNDTDFYLR